MRRCSCPCGPCRRARRGELDGRHCGGTICAPVETEWRDIWDACEHSRLVTWQMWVEQGPPESYA